LFMYGGSAFLNFEFNDAKQFVLAAHEQEDIIFVPVV